MAGMVLNMDARDRMLNVFRGQVRRYDELEVSKKREKERRRLAGDNVEIEVTTTPITTAYPALYGDGSGLQTNDTECPNIIGCHPIQKDV